LKEVEFFRERKMRDSEIDQIAGSMTLKRYHKGECIMQYGDIGETFYFILKGEVKIEVPDSAQEDKYKKHLSKSRFYEEKYDEAHIQIYRLKKH
jgi:CRP-like cAMP-binding protein